jgi:hypothetical protein
MAPLGFPYGSCASAPSGLQSLADGHRLLPSSLLSSQSQGHLSGKRKPSSTVLVLAGELCLRPLEMASGLPVAAGRD